MQYKLEPAEAGMHYFYYNQPSGFPDQGGGSYFISTCNNKLAAISTYAYIKTDYQLERIQFFVPEICKYLWKGIKIVYVTIKLNNLNNWKRRIWCADSTYKVIEHKKTLNTNQWI